MVTLRELLRSVFSVPVLLFAIAALAVVYLPFDFRTSDEMAQEERLDRIAEKVRGLSKERVAEEMGAAGAYGEACGLEIDEVAMTNVMTLSDLSNADIEKSGRLRVEFIRGIERVAGLVATDGGEGKNRDLTCMLGKAAFGADGSIIPGLIASQDSP